MISERTAGSEHPDRQRWTNGSGDWADRESLAEEGVRISAERMREVLCTEGRAFIAAAREVSPAVPVAGVSGRTAGQTVDYLGGLCADVLNWLGAGGDDLADDTDSGGVECSAAIDRFAVRLADLLGEFGTRSPWESCPTWWPREHTVRFWLRRVVHATAVHRVDMQSATGVELAPPARDVAADGVDEVLRVWFAHRLSVLGVVARRSGVVEIRTAGASWLACAGPDRVSVRPLVPNEQAPDATVTGDPAAVYLWLWGRLPDRAISITGDLDAAAQLWSLLRLATR